MVWGVGFPASWGRHNPEAALVIPFDEQIHKLFEAMPKETKDLYPHFREIDYFRAVIDKFTQDPAKQTRNFPPFGPLAEYEWPAEHRLKKRHENLAPIIVAGSGTGHFLVHETLKMLIEHLEPGVHTFHPIAITMPRETVYPVQYYTIMIGNWIDSFLPTVSNTDCFRAKMGSYFINGYTKHDMGGLVLSPERFGKAHFWREKKLLTPDIFISDTLHEHIVRAGLEMHKTFQLSEGLPKRFQIDRN
jgi:hypothetical protein